VTCRAGNTAYCISLQWTKLHSGATLQCNVDRHGVKAAERAIESIQEAIHILAPPPAGEAEPAVEKAEKE
jgi:hypothetical protein